jgi:hypothetical protein
MKKAKLVSMGQSGLDLFSFVSKKHEISKYLEVPPEIGSIRMIHVKKSS